MIIVQVSDFTTDGSYYQFVNNDKNNSLSGLLQTFINKYERKYIYQILGQVQGDAMINDCQANSGVPIIPSNITIFNAININDPEDAYNLRQSEGLKNVLLSLIYYHFAQTSQFKIAISGYINTEVDTSEKLSYANVIKIAEDRYNESIEWIHTIQWYCLVYSPYINNPNPGAYPNFYGQIFRAVSADFL